MSARPNDSGSPTGPHVLAAVRHRTTCLARWLRLPGAAETPDCLSIRYWHRPDPAAPPTESRRSPVLLVHGYGGTEHMWHPLRAALATAGFDHVIALRYNTFRADIRRVADWLVDQAERTMHACDSRAVHLIGHSMGGLVVRSAVQSRGLGDRARTAVTLATPHRGTRFALFAPGPGARQMHPGSAFLRELASGFGQGRTRWIDLEAATDRVVPPGVEYPSPERVRVAAGHRSITRHPAAVARIVAELDRADRTSGHASEFSLAG